jgi:hypothetical protein
MLADTDPTGPEAGVAAGHPATERRDSQRTAVGCCANLSSATGNEKWLFLGVAAMQVIEVTRLDFPKGV